MQFKPVFGFDNVCKIDVSADSNHVMALICRTGMSSGAASDI